MRDVLLYLMQGGYRLAKRMYRRLPPSVHQLLQGPRHSFIRWARSRSVISVCRGHRSKRRESDLGWQEFSQRVLSRRGEYRGIYILERSIDWNVSLYQRPQHIANALGRLGHLVIYRTDDWGGDDVEGYREVAENVWLTNRDEADRIEGVVRSIYSTAILLTPESLMKTSRPAVLVYEYIDHIDAQISGDAENVRRLVRLKEFAFGGGVDYIVASARKLAAEAVEAVGRDKVILIPNGVDVRHYRDPAHQRVVLPDVLVSFRRAFPKIVGYFGALAPWLWYEVISEIVAARTDVGFVFLGPDYFGGSQRLPAAGNLLYLGPVDYAILPAYAAQFDICFIPFTPGEIAQTTSPLKLFEYFALEKPVVVTSDMLECVAFPEVFHGDSAAALSGAIDRALEVKDNPAFKQRLAELADQNDWEQRALAMEILFRRLEAQ